MSLETIVVEGVPELQRRLNPERWWQAMEHVIPRAMAPLLARMPATAPHGRTGKLSRGPYTLRVDRRQAGLVHGLTVAIGAGVPYGHLVDRGHRVIARGRALSSITVRGLRIREGEKRAALRASLLARRAAGGQGFVPGTHFAETAMQGGMAQVVHLVEKLLEVEVSRAV